MNYLWFLLFLLLASGSTHAQSAGLPDRSPQSRETVLEFENELVEGQAASPDLLFLLKRKNLNYGKLLKLRENFLEEMRETRIDVNRSKD